jgi:Na+/H+ antiporter NhaC
MFIKKQFYIPFFLLILFLTIFFFPSISFALQKQKASPNLSLKETIDIFIPPIYGAELNNIKKNKNGKKPSLSQKKLRNLNLIQLSKK